MKGGTRVNLDAVENFGGIDADEDALLRECFQDHPAYLAAKSHDRWLVIGRKGSGKTAIFKRLITERTFDRFAYGHTFDDYPWEHHDLQAQVGVPEERRYFHSWKYLVLMSLSKILLNQDQSQPWSEESAEALGGLESFVVDSYGSRDPDLTQLFLPDRELRLKGSLKFGVGIEAERIIVRELPAHVQQVNSSVQDAVVAALNPEHDYYVCFDQLDLGFTTSDVEYKNRLIGLLLAARDLNRVAKSEGRRFSTVVFLRDDIYHLLQFEDKNKITENNVSRVEWNRPESDLTLRDLMERRFGEVFDGSGTERWESVFDEAKEMPSRQTKYAHICDRTFLRPRDMIKFCNEILRAHKARDHGEQDGRFDNEDVIAAREPYSDYLLRELDDEIAKHVPDYQEHLEVLKTIGNIQFTSSEFKEAWRGRPRLGDEEWQHGLESLFEFSVIAYLKSGGGGGGSKYVYRYMDSRARFDAAAESYRVHPGFKEALDLIQRRARVKSEQRLR